MLHCVEILESLLNSCLYPHLSANKSMMNGVIKINIYLIIEIRVSIIFKNTASPRDILGGDTGLGSAIK